MIHDVMPIAVEVALLAEEEPLPDTSQLADMVRAILEQSGIEEGEVSVAILNDAEIHRANVKHLQHDYPTDVLSFRLDEGTVPTAIDGELIVSWETARRRGPEFGWDAQAELMLYVAHGTLHLVGYDDSTEELRREMRKAERRALQRFDLDPPTDDWERNR